MPCFLGHYPRLKIDFFLDDKHILGIAGKCFTQLRQHRTGFFRGAEITHRHTPVRSFESHVGWQIGHFLIDVSLDGIATILGCGLLVARENTDTIPYRIVGITRTGAIGIVCLWLISNKFSKTTILYDGDTTRLLQIGTNILRLLPKGNS